MELHFHLTDSVFQTLEMGSSIKHRRRGGHKLTILLKSNHQTPALNIHLFQISFLYSKYQSLQELYHLQFFCDFQAIDLPRKTGFAD